MANSKMVRIAFYCIVFSILGAIANADKLAEMIASRAKNSDSLGGPALYNYVENTVPDILTRNDLPASVDQSIEQRRDDLRAQGAPLYPNGLPSILDDVDVENGPTAFDDLSSILGLPKPQRKPKPIKIIPQDKPNKINYDNLAASIAGVPSPSSTEPSENDQAETTNNDIHDPLDDKIAEFLSCWDSVPSNIKGNLSPQKQSDFKKFSEYVRDLHLLAPSSYSSFDGNQAYQLAMESNFFLGECMKLGEKKTLDLEEVEDGKYKSLDKKIVEFLTCWEGLPADFKNALPAAKLANLATMATYVQKVHSQIALDEELDKSATDNLEWGMNVHIDRCHELEAHHVLNLSADF
ncbi:uncharacterized protein LOC141855661 isoform X3 [Brevipalpus obovatus]|uniref:uncharacterized protein LOC141855661 isoform X3 n=1 Tax=Brevipalpus obovatus TaxID=246614 RepID=UPI003D9ED9EB